MSDLEQQSLEVTANGDEGAMDTGKVATPIYDFLRQYENSDIARFHMPGHKGNPMLGPEPIDLTEVTGADSLYASSGIIRESEEIATKLFRSGATFYGTEGSSQCIKTMLAIARMLKYRQPYTPSLFGMNRTEGRSGFTVLAPRNVHRSFVDAMAMLDGKVRWIWPKGSGGDICSPVITVKELERIMDHSFVDIHALYVTAPDYLGRMPDLKELSKFCKTYDILLLVDHAHGAYLRFDPNYEHPLDIGADMVCESAHKTLPVLTGGAYLHFSKQFWEKYLKAQTRDYRTQFKSIMGMYGSTSPSYLTLASLDICNLYLSTDYPERLASRIHEVAELKKRLVETGYLLLANEPLKITIYLPSGGKNAARILTDNQVECEFSDPDFIVFMISVENRFEDLEHLEKVLIEHFHEIQQGCYLPYWKQTEEQVQAAGADGFIRGNNGFPGIPYFKSAPKQKHSIRFAMMEAKKSVPIEKAEGFICAETSILCPPAIPIVIPGEIITKTAIEVLKYYGYTSIMVLDTSFI